MADWWRRLRELDFLAMKETFRPWTIEISRCCRRACRTLSARTILARFILALVLEHLDLGDDRSRRYAASAGNRRLTPAMMTALLLYG